MNTPPSTSRAILFEAEPQSNEYRRRIAESEPHSLRTYTPTQAVIAESSGPFHYTPEGRRLWDYSSGVLVANLGHNPAAWVEKLQGYLGWNVDRRDSESSQFLRAPALTAYNALTPLEAEATERLLSSLRQSQLGQRMQTVIWAASGSEAVQKALWACMQFDPERPMILATRGGFHGKKGLAGAVTGSERDPERDRRVCFIDFPKDECSDLESPDAAWHPDKWRQDLEDAWAQCEGRVGCLITEPYLGGGGSYHPPHEWLQLVAEFCREKNILFILDEVQSNFGRTGSMYAFEEYGVEPDFVCLGKGLGNGVPVSAAVGRRDVCEKMGYGATSDTWSANPISSAAVLATLDAFETTDILARTRVLSEQFVRGLSALKSTEVIARVRGEGMVFGIECGEVGSRSAEEVAVAVVRRCYLGDDDGQGIHLLGPLAGKVIRVSPPMCLTDEQAEASLQLFKSLIESVGQELSES